MKPREKCLIRYSVIANNNNLHRIIPACPHGRRLQNAGIQDIRHTGSRAHVLLKSYSIKCCNIIDQRQSQAGHVFGI